MKKHPFILVAAGSALWGFIGIFIKALSTAGFTSMEITFIRSVTTSVFLFLYMAIFDRTKLKIQVNDIKYFLATGIFSMVLFNWCYFTSIKETSLSIAVVLLYTAPAFVIIISKIFFREEITRNKITALILTASGIFLTAGLIPGQIGSLSNYGILTGLGAGFGYSLYSIFAKIAGKKYSSLTVTAYTFLVASLFLVPVSSPVEKSELLLRGDIIFYCTGLGLLPTSLAYILYTSGLKYIEAGKAAITSNIEPAVAIIIGTVFFGETLSVTQLAGILMIFISVFIVQGDTRKQIQQNTAHRI